MSRWEGVTPEERFWDKVDLDGPTSPFDGTSCWWSFYQEKENNYVYL